MQPLDIRPPAYLSGLRSQVPGLSSGPHLYPSPCSGCPKVSLHLSGRSIVESTGLHSHFYSKGGASFRVRPVLFLVLNKAAVYTHLVLGSIHIIL